MSESTSRDKDLPQPNSLLTNPHPGTFRNATGRCGRREFTSFHLQILRCLYGTPDYGLGIKRALEAHYGNEVSHGRLYPNLDDLVDTGYVEKSERDKRTNEYSLTEKGRQQVEDHAASTLHQLGLDVDDIQSLLHQLSPTNNDTESEETVLVNSSDGDGDELEVAVADIETAADNCATVGEVADELDTTHGRARTLLVHANRYSEVTEEDR